MLKIKSPVSLDSFHVKDKKLQNSFNPGFLDQVDSDLKHSRIVSS